MTTLRELRLGHNHIKYLPPGLFNNSISLERLILYGNRIEILVRGVFRGLVNLTSLFLQSNRLRILQSGVFEDTPNLRKLWVQKWIVIFGILYNCNIILKLMSFNIKIFCTYFFYVISQTHTHTHTHTNKVFPLK